MPDINLDELPSYIEGLQAEIERLNSELLAERLSNVGKVHPCDDNTAANLASALAEIERLREAMRPFAALPVDALGQCQRHPDEPVFAINGVSFSATDVRRAREALGEKQ